MSFSCPPHILRQAPGTGLKSTIVAYKNGDFTDLVISCGSSTFDVHSVVVGAGCEVFAKSLKSDGKEVEERRIDLPDNDPEMIRRQIAYLYLGDYDPTDDFGINALEQLKQYESEIAAAPTYHRRQGVFGSSQSHDRCACLAINTKNVEQSASDKKASNRIKTRTPDNSIEIANSLMIHATIQVAKAKFQKCLDCHVDSEDFIAAVQLKYSNTSESNCGLRDVIVQAFLSYFKVNITELPGLESKLDTIDELSFLLLKSWSRKTEPTSPQKPASSAFVAHTALNTGASAAPSISSTIAPATSNTLSIFHTASTTTSRANTSASTSNTGSLFGNLPRRTSGGFGSFQLSPSSRENAQTNQHPFTLGT